MINQLKNPINKDVIKKIENLDYLWNCDKISYKEYQTQRNIIKAKLI